MEEQSYSYKQNNSQSSQNGKPSRGKTAVLLVIPLFVLLITGFVLNLVVFHVSGSQILIELEFDGANNPAGEQPMETEQIRKALGVEGGTSYFSISADTIEKSISQYNSSPDQRSFLKLVSFEKRAPSYVHIVVKQRQRIARIRGSEGNVCVIDEDGVMLEYVRVKDINEPVYPGLILLKDMIPKEIPRKTGNTVKLVDSKQMDVYTLVITQMLDLDILYTRLDNNQIMLAYTEMYIADTESIVLTTWDGYTVILSIPAGDDVWELRAKLRTMEIVMSEVRKDEMIHSTGVLRINKVGEGTFTPE